MSKIKGVLYKVRLSRIVELLVPTLVLVSALLILMLWNNSINEMLFPVTLVIGAGLAPTLLVFIDYIFHDYGSQLIVNKFERQIIYINRAEKKVIAFNDILRIEKFVSRWHFLPVSNYYFFAIYLNSGEKITISCLSANKLVIGKKNIEKIYTNLPLLSGVL